MGSVFLPVNTEERIHVHLKASTSVRAINWLQVDEIFTQFSPFHTHEKNRRNQAFMTTFFRRVLEEGFFCRKRALAHWQDF